MFLAVSFLCLSPKKTVDVDPEAKLCFLLQDLCIVPCVDTDDMEKIQVYVRHALSFLHSVTHRGGRVLFLESLTTFGSTEILNKMLHELAEVLGAPNREGRCGKVWWEYKQAWTEEVDERPPGCVVILNPGERAHILRKARHAKVPIFFP